MKYGDNLLKHPGTLYVLEQYDLKPCIKMAFHKPKPNRIYRPEINLFEETRILSVISYILNLICDKSLN